MTARDRYFEEFMSFWSARPEVRQIWFSFFTPQLGVEADETLTATEKATVLSQLTELRDRFPKAYLLDSILKGFQKPPQSPADCIFARTTINFTADLQSKITPCQFGGEPDCSQCGCFASIGLNAIGDYRLLKIIPVRALYDASDAIGKGAAKLAGRDR
jgi:hypothetical protein